MPQLPADPAAHIAACLKWLHPGGEVFEIRLFNPAVASAPQCWEGRAYGGQAKAVVAGWFRDQAKAVELLTRIGQLKDGKKVGAEAIYVTLNPCREEFLARVNERLKANQKPTTEDRDITARHNFLIDLDPRRPAGISSSDNEHEAALLFAQQVKAELSQAGWPEPLLADSGNGAHLVYAVELDNTDEHRDLLAHALGALAQRYAERLAACGLDLDRVVFNAARISKVYGTRTGKGDSTQERPHRYSKILDLPAVRPPVSLTLLQDLAAFFVPQASGGSGGSLHHSGEEKGEGSLDLAAYLGHYGVEVVKVKEHGGAKLHCLAQCLFNPGHTANEASIGQAADGKLFYQCFHNSCKGVRTWAMAKELISGADKLGQFVIGGSAPAKKGKGKLWVVGGGSPAPTQPPGDGQAAPPATAGLTWSDLGNARRLVARHGRDLRYNHLNKEWYVWGGNHWLVDNYGEVARRAKATVESIYDEAKDLEWDSDKRKNVFKFALKSESAGRLMAMMQLAQSEPGISVLPEEFDADPWLFNVANGTIDLQTGELRPHRRADLLTCLSPIGYDSAAACPTFERFLFEIMGGARDQETAQRADSLSYFLQQAFGYALTGDCREQCFWMFCGSGANGKGTLMDCLERIFGSYSMGISTETLLAKDNSANQIRSDVARLDGPRLVIAAEIDKGRRLSESLVKGLTGQDTITARFLYGKDFDFKPVFKLFVQSNNKPIIRDLTNAMWRRLKLIEFPMDYRDKPDYQLPEKLKAEDAGILAWMVRGCLSWQQAGHLVEPKEVTEATQDYRDTMDPLKEFLEACCFIGEEYTATAGDLFKAYNTWAEDNQVKKEKLIKRTFGQALAETGFKSGKGTAGVRLWRGLGLNIIE